LIIEFIGNLLHLTTDNYNTFAILHNLQITTLLSKSFYSVRSSCTHCFVTASTNLESLPNASVPSRFTHIDSPLTASLSLTSLSVSHGFWLISCSSKLLLAMPVHSFLVPGPMGLMTILFLSHDSRSRASQEPPASSLAGSI
jgi:hypothetical protein